MSPDNNPPVHSGSDYAVEQATVSPVIKSSRKSKILLSIVALLILVAGGAAAYILLIHLPNTPENIFKKATSDFINSGSYTISGDFNTGAAADPNFSYVIKTAGQDAMLEIQSQQNESSPRVDFLQIGQRNYIKFSDWRHRDNLTDKASLAEKNLASAAEKMGILGAGSEWLEVDEFILEGVESEDVELPTNLEEVGVTIGSHDDVKKKDGKQIRTYQVEISKEGFDWLLSYVGKTSILGVTFGDYAEDNGFPDKLTFEMDIDVKAREVVQLSYNGMPFRDAELSINIQSADHELKLPQASKLASQAMGFGITNTFLFHPTNYLDRSPHDQKRIADMKIIKTALEIYYRQHGNYPHRTAPSLPRDNLLKLMPGVNQEAFVDPSGRFLNQYGSQYTYIPEDASGSGTCGTSFYSFNTGESFQAPDCVKFWIVTRLDNGQEYKLVSD